MAGEGRGEGIKKKRDEQRREIGGQRCQEAAIVLHFIPEDAGQSFSAGATFRSRSVRHTKVWSHNGNKKEMKVGVFHGSASESAKHRRVLINVFDTLFFDIW